MRIAVSTIHHEILQANHVSNAVGKSNVEPCISSIFFKDFEDVLVHQIMVEAKTIWYSRNQNKENHVNQPVTFVKTNIIVAGIMVVPIILENVVSGNASVNIYMVPLLEV